MNNSANQNDFLVGSIQQYVSSINNGHPQQHQQPITRMRSITKGKPITKSSKLRKISQSIIINSD